MAQFDTIMYRDMHVDVNNNIRSKSTNKENMICTLMYPAWVTSCAHIILSQDRTSLHITLFSEHLLSSPHSWSQPHSVMPAPLVSTPFASSDQKTSDMLLDNVKLKDISFESKSRMRKNRFTFLHAIFLISYSIAWMALIRPQRLSKPYGLNLISCKMKPSCQDRLRWC